MNKKTIQAVKDSITHWKADILKPLKAGKEIVNAGGLYWAKKNGSMSTREVKCFTESCPLCKLFYHPYTDCTHCPLVIGDNDCNDDGSSWDLFRDNPCIETAEAMIETLESLLEDK